MRRVFFLFSSFSFVLAACGGPQDDAAPSPEEAAAPAAGGAFSVAFRCGGATVLFSGDQETATLEAGGESYFLERAVSGSGARYVDPDDPDTFFWNKGREATASIRGEQLPPCAEAGDGDAAGVEAAMEDETLTARGNEPGWLLEIADGELSLTWNYGEDELTAAAPAPEKNGDVKRYSLPEEDLEVTVTQAVCNDDATGMPHPYRVAVEIRGQTLNGCGGEPASLLKGDWVVEAIDNGGVIDSSHATLSFGDGGRLAGSGSCNNYSAAYTLGGEGLSIGPAAATKKACAPALMNQEQKFFDSLAKTDRFEIDETGALILHGEGGARILARRTD